MSEARKWLDKLAEEKNYSEDCIEYPFWKDPDGYGRFCVDRAKVYAHRYILSLKGLLIEEKIVCHTCNNPACCNPNHLYVGSQKENMKDREIAGNTPKGIKNGRAKLTEDQVRYIRSAPGSSSEIAASLPVSKWVVQDIRKGKTWKHIK